MARTVSSNINPKLRLTIVVFHWNFRGTGSQTFRDKSDALKIMDLTLLTTVTVWMTEMSPLQRRDTDKSQGSLKQWSLEVSVKAMVAKTLGGA